MRQPWADVNQPYVGPCDAVTIKPPSSDGVLFTPALALSDRAWVVDNSGHQFALGARSDSKSVKVLEGAPAWIRDLLRSIPDNAMRQAQ